MATTLEHNTSGIRLAAERPMGTAARAAWPDRTDLQRAELLAQCSESAIAGTNAHWHDGAGDSEAFNDRTTVEAQLPMRCDRIMHDVAALVARRPAEHGPAGNITTELIVDDGFPLELATVHLVSALIGGESVVLGLTRHVEIGALSYFRALSTLLPGGVLHILHGERLVRGGTNRTVWLSLTCVTDCSPAAQVLAHGIVSMEASRATADVNDSTAAVLAGRIPARIVFELPAINREELAASPEQAAR